MNSAPLTAAGFRGKVVLVDFWEYTCINWIRTLPYIKAWNRDYASLGLVVVGVHAPEFKFGKRLETSAPRGALHQTRSVHIEDSRAPQSTAVVRSRIGEPVQACS